MYIKPHIEDNYHPEDRYEEHRPGADGFAKFHDPENNQWYFAYYHKDELVLRSEGYQSEAARDSGLKTVEAHMKDDDNYVAKMLPDGKWVLELRSGNNKEIARTPRYDEEHIALSMKPSSIAARDAVHDTSAEKLNRKDDYLACKEYKDRPRSEQHPEFTVFEENNEYYFALVDKDGNLLLRGEGYKTEAGRAKGIEAVLHNKGEEKRYKIEENLGYHFVVLRSGNNKEIARSCPKDHAGALALIALLVAPVAPLAGATPVPEVEVEKQSSNWWMWALLILALIVLFFLWRSCNEAPAEEPPMTSEVKEEVPANTGPVYAFDHDCHWIPVLFDIDSYVVSEEGREDIEGVVNEMNTNPEYRALFIGFSDATGTEEHNIVLSQKRADAVKAVAVEMGIDASRISTSEEDEHNPIAINTVEEGRKYNRRVVMFVLNKDNHLVCRQQELQVPEDLKAE